MDVVLVVLHVAFFAPVLLRVVAQRRTARGRQSAGLRTEIAAGARHPVLVLHGVGLLFLWTGVVLALARGRVSGTITIQALFGAALLLCALLLMAWSIAALRSWRLLPTADAEHELCTSGPYQFVRHPMYLAVNLLGIGSAVWVPTAPVVIGAIVLIVGGDLRARLEEKALLEAFGRHYREYSRHVRRTLPGIY